MRRAIAAVLLLVVLVTAVGCASVPRGSAAQQSLQEIGAKPGEPVRSMLDSSGPTGLDSRLLAAIDRHKPWSAETRVLGGVGPQQPSTFAPDPKASPQGFGFEEVAYVFDDKSELLVQSIVNSSGLRVLVSMTVQ